MFRVRVRMADRSLVTDSVFPLRRQAQDRAAEIDIAVRRGSSGYPRHPPVSLSAWAGMCAKSWLITPATRESYDGHLRRHILPALGELPLEVIDRAAVQEWIGRLREIMAPGSVHDVVKVLSLLMNAAVREGRIARNPCWQLNLRTISPERPHATAAQVIQVADRMGFWIYQAAVVTAAYTGLRFGELAGLRRDCVDVERGWIYIDRQHGSLIEIGGRLLAGPPKTPAGAGRIITVPPFLSGLLALVLAAHDEPYVFVGSRRAVLRRNGFGRVWRKAVREVVALPGNQMLRGLHFHDMRGTHKTWMLEDNIPLVAQYQRLGHKLKGIEGVYGHNTPRMQQQITTSLQKRWNASGGPALATEIENSSQRLQRTRHLPSISAGV